RLRSRLPYLSPRVKTWTVLAGCVLLWGTMALWVAPMIETAFVSPRQMSTCLGVYAIVSVLLTAHLWGSPGPPPIRRVRQWFWNVLRANAGRVGGLFALLVLVMLLARSGAEAWAGRLSALPLLPFYSLLILSSPRLHACAEVADLEHVGSTVL